MTIWLSHSQYLSPQMEFSMQVKLPQISYSTSRNEKVFGLLTHLITLTMEVSTGTRDLSRPPGAPHHVVLGSATAQNVHGLLLCLTVCRTGISAGVTPAETMVCVKVTRSCFLAVSAVSRHEKTPDGENSHASLCMMSMMRRSQVLTLAWLSRAPMLIVPDRRCR